jgi:hypothetical protein
MAITYVKKKYGETELKFPVLHRVYYGKTMPTQWQISYLDYKVNEWLKENCKHPHYRSPGYLDEKFIEFEDDEDATWFALKWAI